jgi:hypothetical protein
VRSCYLLQALYREKSAAVTDRSINHTITLKSQQRTAQHWKRWDLLTRHQRALSCRHQHPHDYTGCLNGTSCSFDFMACSVCLEVTPRSATSSVSGDDTSTIVPLELGCARRPLRDVAEHILA